MMALAGGAYPLLAEWASGPTLDEQFQLSLNFLLDGIAARLLGNGPDTEDMLRRPMSFASLGGLPNQYRCMKGIVVSTVGGTAAPSQADCPPEVRITKSLLGYGVIAGPFYVIASLAEALLRPGFDLSRHSWSLLENGRFGWIHILVLILTGLMVIAAAIGIARQLRLRLAPVLIGIYGLGMVGAGIFTADPADGFPIGTPPGPGVISWHGTLHLVCGGVGFLAITVACVLLGIRFFRAGEAGWGVFTLVAGIFFLGAFAGIASGGTGPIVLVFTAAVILIWAWLSLLSLRLYREAAAPFKPSAVASGTR